MRTPERAGDLRGVLSLEFALVVVGVLGALMLLGAAWRLGQTRGEMRDVAAEAARAASLLQNPRSAAAAAEKTAQETLGRSGIRCSNFSVAADVSALRPGGSVAVEIRCISRLEDLTLLRMPGSVSLQATAVEVVDQRRGGT
ncbi:MAG: pilus assembly protein [Acidimicrobiia bacterium]|nr:pilus assembly protein [bacterium]MYB24400.1 pilus assembly protein [Acidimicrobiia bacterium]